MKRIISSRKRKGNNRNFQQYDYNQMVAVLVDYPTIVLLLIINQLMLSIINQLNQMYCFYTTLDGLP